MSDVDLFAGLGASPNGSVLAPESAPTPPSPSPGSDGVCEPYGEPWGREPEGRQVRCRFPAGCQEESVFGSLRCVDHLRHGDLLDYAESYAVASIVYYGGHESEFMRDAQFDGLCSYLLSRQAWRVVPWLEREMLKAGSGYDVSKFPPELHEAAREWMESESRTYEGPKESKDGS